jgi:hypothetical protein
MPEGAVHSHTAQPPCRNQPDRRLSEGIIDNLVLYQDECGASRTLRRNAGVARPVHHIEPIRYPCGHALLKALRCPATAPARIVTSRMTSRTISSMSLFRGSVRFNRSSHGVLGSDCLLPSPYFANSRCGGSTQTVMAQAGSPFGWGTGWHLANARARSLSRISIRPTWADAEVTVVPSPSRMATIS